MPRLSFSHLRDFTYLGSLLDYQSRMNTLLDLERIKDRKKLEAQVILKQPSTRVLCFQQQLPATDALRTDVQVPNINGTELIRLSSFEDVYKLMQTRTNGKSEKAFDIWMPPPSGSGYSIVQVTLSRTDAANDTLIKEITPNSNPDTWSNTTLTACGVRATWVAARYIVSPPTVVPQMQSQPLNTESEVQAEPIRIHPSFAEEMWKIVTRNDSKDDIFKTPPMPWNSSAIDTISPTERPASQEMVLAAFFANALANAEPERHSPRNQNHTCNEYEVDTMSDSPTPTNCSIPTSLPPAPCPSSFDQSFDNCSTIPLTLLENGWGYTREFPNTRIALAMLCAYLLGVLSYIFSLFMRSTCTAWQSPVDLVALALQSRPPDPKYLGHVSVRINEDETLVEPDELRENEEGKLELVFKNDPQHEGRRLRKIEVNKRY
ncbi:unnamed protein product [Periconia digitata]|uniref:Uncharacterized protein n=1 Tax=Periconia digitata TaxID=1303443 RepID=A0A9W4UTP1_9PLEO|nr:unnamed protein product [Periconia digitata]